MKTSIAIVDYGMGNLRSVAQAMRHAAPEAEVAIVNQPDAIRAADRVVLPGQGAMPDCMRCLRESGLQEAVKEAARNKPLLGICVGEQMLFDWSAEGDTPGLGLMPGRVLRFELDGQLQDDGSRFKVPQMGWNRVRQTQASHTAGETMYGSAFTSAVAHANIFATQFHPEKSADAGLRLYRNFVQWKP